jgi:uncharacterized membrane protein YeaQ/YmgE (transglycosylase-associated protein family)
MWTFWGLAVQIVAGFLGAHAAAVVSHEHRFGFVGHSLAGLVGGALSGSFLQTAAITVVTANGSHNAEVAADTAAIHVMAVAVAGAIAMLAVAMFKKA